MKVLRLTLCVFLMAAVCHAGVVADKQMEKFFAFLKKAKYKEASLVILEKVEIAPEQKEVNIAQYTGIFKTIITQHGKPLNYTKWRTKRLSKNFDETIYQINCEKSAWMIMIREYVQANGGSTFSEFNIVTEDDIFKKYVK